MASTEIVACPYTAGGCPLFNTQLPGDSPGCTGGCSPPATVIQAPPPAARTPTMQSAPLLVNYDSSMPLGPGDISQYLYAQALPLPPLSPRDTNSTANALPGPSSTSTSTSVVTGTKRDLADIEELVNWGQSSPKTKMMNTSGAQPRGVENQAVNPRPLADTAAAAPDDSATPFISKLVYLLSQPEAHDYVRWDIHGKAVILAHTKEETLAVLAKYFRHTTVSSFVRQLNIYGFKRLQTTQLLHALGTTTDFSASDYCAFSHPEFFKSTPEHRCRLAGLRPQANNPKNRPSKRRKTSRKQSTDDDSE